MANTYRSREVFENLNIPETFPEIPDSTGVQALWSKLLEINHLLSVRPENLTAEKVSKFESQSKEFVRTFTELYPAKRDALYALHDATCWRIYEDIRSTFAVYPTGT